MISGFLPVLLLMLGAWVWLDGARAREFATALVRRHCEHNGLQFLDETVALARIGIRWTSEGLRIRRMFRFEFSLEGVGRQTGYILMLGMRLEAIDDGLPVDEPADDGTADRPAIESGDNVVPFRRRDK
ncbi:MAG: DUF3301 domain-containing protein [Gammaproteobacteria bacterium]|nr:DUF3301 domain-containing protein [Gammaproteobacteria bacterium]